MSLICAIVNLLHKKSKYIFLGFVFKAYTHGLISRNYFYINLDLQTNSHVRAAQNIVKQS